MEERKLTELDVRHMLGQGVTIAAIILADGWSSTV
jgi:hypothetical protein